MYSRNSDNQQRRLRLVPVSSSGASGFTEDKLLLRRGAYISKKIPILLKIID